MAVLYVEFATQHGASGETTKTIRVFPEQGRGRRRHGRNLCCNFHNMNSFHSLSLPSLFALSALLLATPPDASAFPRTKEKAELVVSATLTPADPASTASGSASIEITRLHGVQTVSALELTLTGVAPGTYTVGATKTSDGTSVTIGTVTSPAPENDPGLTLPEGLDPLDIATLSVSDATQAVSGSASLTIVRWEFAANVRVTAPVTTTSPGDPKPKKVHGHVLIHARIVNNVEEKRKFLLVAHGGPADTELTINLDGVAAGSVLTTKNGKMMAKELPGTALLAGVGTMTLTDAAGVVVAQADFFPEVL